MLSIFLPNTSYMTYVFIEMNIPLKYCITGYRCINYAILQMVFFVNNTVNIILICRWNKFFRISYTTEEAIVSYWTIFGE